MALVFGRVLTHLKFSQIIRPTEEAIRSIQHKSWQRGLPEETFDRLNISRELEDNGRFKQLKTYLIVLKRAKNMH